MRWGGAALVLTALGFGLSCGPRSAVTPESLFPASSDVAGWVRTREIRVFQASDLWKYMDGDAERYIQAGVQRTLTADYRYQNRIDAVADIHAMATAEGARKVLDSESSIDSQALPFGDAGRLYRASLVFRRGPYFVRLVAYSDAPETASALMELARRMDEKIQKQGTK
jgi:hypothetical protein